jgi:hypothetical protein
MLVKLFNIQCHGNPFRRFHVERSNRSCRWIENAPKKTIGQPWCLVASFNILLFFYVEIVLGFPNLVWSWWQREDNRCHYRK